MRYGAVEQGEAYSGDRTRPQVRKWSFFTSGVTLFNALVLLANVAAVVYQRRSQEGALALASTYTTEPAVTSLVATGPVGCYISQWEEEVEAAGGQTPLDLTSIVAEIEGRLDKIINNAQLKASNCTCGSNCAQLDVYRDKEFFGYGAGDYERIRLLEPHPTTIVLGAYNIDSWSESLMCTAHGDGTRILLSNPSSLGTTFNYEMGNATAVADWIESKVYWAAEHYADGFVFDEEDSSPMAYNSEWNYAFSAIVALTNATLQVVRPGSTLAVAVAWGPDGVDQRYYDYRGLAFGAYTFFVMGYSLNSQVFNRCVACGNSHPQLQHGLEHFLALGIPAAKLVLGTSWGGTIWECTNYDGTSEGQSLEYCAVHMVGGEGVNSGYRGVNCSDAVASTCDNLDTCWDMLSSQKTTFIGFDKYVRLPFFNYLDEGKLFQVWYEDSYSVAKKYEMASMLGIRGVGPYTFSKLNYSRPDQVAVMWSTFCEFFECSGLPP